MVLKKNEIFGPEQNTTKNMKKTGHNLKKRAYCEINHRN